MDVGGGGVVVVQGALVGQGGGVAHVPIVGHVGLEGHERLGEHVGSMGHSGQVVVVVVGHCEQPSHGSKICTTVRASKPLISSFA